MCGRDGSDRTSTRGLCPLTHACESRLSSKPLWAFAASGGDSDPMERSKCVPIAGKLSEMQPAARSPSELAAAILGTLSSSHLLPEFLHLRGHASSCQGKLLLSALSSTSPLRLTSPFATSSQPTNWSKYSLSVF